MFCSLSISVLHKGPRQRAMELVDMIGKRSRMLAHQLDMHAWVRTLAVPGRGSPMFVLHDEYSSWSTRGTNRSAVSSSGLNPSSNGVFPLFPTLPLRFHLLLWRSKLTDLAGPMNVVACRTSVSAFWSDSYSRIF